MVDIFAWGGWLLAGFLVILLLSDKIVNLLKICGWLQQKLENISRERAGWEDYVDDIKSLEGATDVNLHSEDYQISLEYTRSKRQFHQQTKYDYEIIDFKKPLLMIEPLG